MVKLRFIPVVSVTPLYFHTYHKQALDKHDDVITITMNMVSNRQHYSEDEILKAINSVKHS